MLQDFLTAIGLLLVLEGLLYAIFPDAMRRAVAAVLTMPADRLRTIGMICAILGVGVIWLVRRAGLGG